MQQVDRGSPVPLYQQLAAILRGLITSGQLGPAVPSARRLAAEHDVSEITARKAVDVLKEEGLLVATSGRGTFVKPQE